MVFGSPDSLHLKIGNLFNLSNSISMKFVMLCGFEQANGQLEVVVDQCPIDAMELP